jgi:FkbM family methyltransferase
LTPLQKFFSAWKARRFLPKHIIDVGANHGYWTRAALKYFPDSYYTLIEPQDHLKKHVQDLLTRGDNKIRWIGAGIGDKPGILPLKITNPDHGSTFVVSSEQSESCSSCQIKVPVITLNDIVRTSSAPFPEMVKIDTQGFDLRVIAGASELLGRTDIFLIEALIEFRGWENTLENVIVTMCNADYHVIDFTDLGRSSKYGVLFYCEVAFLRNGSSLIAEVDPCE